MDYDVLVVGSGIGGMESALKLGDMGYHVLVVEKEPSVGGKMILLSKVFPTLDCASCISTPKMAATIHHPNVTVLTDSEVDGIARDGDGALPRDGASRSPASSTTARCTGCRQCELACTVAVPDQFNGDMVSRRAAYIAFPQAVPKKARDRARGHLALHVRLPGRASRRTATSRSSAAASTRRRSSSCSRRRRSSAASVAPATRPARASARAAPRGPARRSAGSSGSSPTRTTRRRTGTAGRTEPNGKRVAVVGSGPAGLTAAWQLARKGYGVKIFEAAPEPGGALRLAIPAYRLPAEVVERDVANVTELGVEIADEHARSTTSTR